MPLDVALRAPSVELQERYRAEALWLDTSLGEFFDAQLDRGANLEVRFWSDTAPYRGTFGDVHREARRFAAGLRRAGYVPAMSSRINSRTGSRP